MKLLVGLGNPGAKYARNRHNIGFLAVDAIAADHGCAPWRKRFQGLASEGEIGGDRVLLLKPETFMNESGRAVGEAMRFLKLTPADVVVLHDELDLEPGRIKVKVGGGNAGHNGLRSITAHIGNEYPRVRLGIGHPGHKDLVSGYVLHDFAKAEETWLRPLLEAIAASAPALVGGRTAAFLTDVALRTGGAAPPAAAAAGGPRAGGSTTGGSKKGAPGAGERTGPSGAASTDTPAGGTGRGRHPAGERQSKRAGALADNLAKFLARRPDPPRDPES